MKSFLLISTLVFSLSTFGQHRDLNVTVSNKWNQPKTDEPVTISLSEIKKLDFAVKSAIVTLNGEEIPCQLDDFNGDFCADELVFLTNIGAKEVQKFNITLKADEQQIKYPSRVYADMMLDDKKGKHPFITSIEAPGESYIYSDLYHHGAAFESELTAFRVYFDHRQNIDIYGKKLYRLELKDTHFYTTPEQMKQDYGNDVLWAGNSIGCGSFKNWNGKSPENMTDVKLRGQRIIAAGPLRTVVEVKDMGWRKKNADANSKDKSNNADTSVLNMRQYYILYGGHRECEVRICFDSALGEETFCTGVQKIGSEPQGFTKNNGIAASWGSDYPEMGKKEIFPPETVGLAVYVPEEFIKEQHTDELNYLFVIGAKGKKQMKYYVTFCADKEEKGYHSANEWFNSLDSWRSSLMNPVEIKTSF